MCSTYKFQDKCASSCLGAGRAGSHLGLGCPLTHSARSRMLLMLCFSFLQVGSSSQWDDFYSHRQNAIRIHTLSLHETVCFAPNLSEGKRLEVVRTGALRTWEENTKDLNGRCGKSQGWGRSRGLLWEEPGR